MPVFAYRAADRAGRTVDGVMEAYDANAVVERLHRENYYPVRVEATDERGRAGRRLLLGAPRIPARDVLAFTQQLATLVEAGLPLERALVVLGDVADNRRLRQIVQDVTQSVRSGSTLADALARHQPRPFSRLYVNTVRAGEHGGVLEIALRRLAEHLDAARELREAIVSALIYPALLLVVGTGAVIFLLTFVLPRFAVILADLGQTLPLPTRLVLGASDVIITYWWAIAAAALVVTVLWQAVARSEAGRLQLDTQGRGRTRHPDARHPALVRSALAGRARRGPGRGWKPSGLGRPRHGPHWRQARGRARAPHGRDGCLPLAGHPHGPGG